MIQFGGLTTNGYQSQNVAKWTQQNFEPKNTQVASAPFNFGVDQKPVKTEAATQGRTENAAIDFVNNGLNYEGMEKVMASKAVQEAREIISKAYEDAEIERIAQGWNGSPKNQDGQGMYDHVTGGILGAKLDIG